jgi:VWFA-related protein
MKGLLPVLAATAALALASPAAQTKFKSRVESVRFDALVTQDGRPVNGLTAPDFEVRDNGVLQKVTVVEESALPVDVILALDMSASLTQDRMLMLREAAFSLLDALDDDDRAALVTFTHVLTRRQGLTADHRLVRTALPETAQSGGTALIDAIYAALAMSEPGEHRTLLIVLSDGVDTASWLDPDSVIRSAHRSETVIYAVSTAGPNRSPGILKEITAASGGEVFEVDSARLASTFVEIVKEFRRRYLLNYTHERTPAPGWHRIDVRVKRRGAVVKARSGYDVR